MKKLLLLLAAACFVFVANAQKATDLVKEDQKTLLYDSEYQRAPVPPSTINYSPGDEVSEVEKIDVGIAHSQRSYRREDCKVISYNKDLDMIMMSFVIDEETYPNVALSDGSVGTFYSTDHGMTWNGPVLLSDVSEDEKRNYYLSASIYNPTGNNIAENAYGVYQGVAPDNPGGVLGDWNNQTFGSNTFSGDNYYTEYFVNSEPDHAHDGYFSQFDLVQVEDYMKCFNIWAEGPWAGFTELKMEDIHGTYDGAQFQWDLENSVIDMPFNTDVAGEAMWVGKFTFSDVGASMVWSDDGEIGYAWMTGASYDNLKSGYQPILYRTDDAGASWNNIELDFQDEDWQEFFADGATDPTEWLIYPSRDINEDFTDFCIPWFNSTAGAVDAEGNLQMVAHLTSHYYDFFNDWEYFENIGSRYVFCGSLFKFTIGTELIDIMLVDTLMSNAAQDLVTGANDSLYCGTNAWLHRLQITKDERSEEFFVTWTDTEEGNRISENFEPDLRGWSYNITTGESTEPFCYTCGTTFPFEHYWFVSAADYAYYNADDETFTVPMVNAITLADFYGNSVASADPIHVQYIDGVTFPAIDPIPVGIDEVSGTTSFDVSQNQPNPATESTTIEISSETVAPVKVEVSNIIGQTIRTIDAGIINGNMSVSINVSDLESGVYLYSVTIGTQRISKRMLVR